MDDIFSSFGKRLKEARLARGLTQTELCGGFVTRNQLSQIEGGKSLPSLPTLCAFARALNVPVGYFFSDDSEERCGYSSFLALDEVRRLYASGDFSAAVDAASSLPPAARSDELSMLLALSYFRLGLDLADSLAFGEAEKCLRLARKEALSSFYTVGTLPAAANYFLTLLSSFKADRLPEVITSLSSVSAFVSPDTVFYFRMLSDDSFDFDSYSFADAPFQLHADALRLMRSGLCSDAFDILMPLSRETPLPFYLKYQLLSTLESCAGIVGDFECAYEASRMKLDFLRSADDTRG